MTEKLRILLAALLLGLCCYPAVAQDEPAETEAAEEPAATVDEVLVVTASRTEQKLHDVPASITVITAEELATAPADDYGDLLRTVPGLNVAQMSTRDIQVSSRQSTNSLSTGQLVLIDGRTLYLDFFGFVMWDFLPINTSEVKQIEVVQGPGSSVWGANAMKGVINVITKPPREIVGTSVQLGGGEYETLYGSVTHAGAGDKLSYKVSGTYYQQDEPFDRPTGTIPGTNTPYPPFQNSGTEQPKFDTRLDYDTSDDSTLSFSAGYAGTDGIMHSGIGPFDIDKNSSLTYGKASWNKRAMNFTVFANLLDGEAANLLTVGLDGRPIQLGFESQTYNADFTNTSVVAGSHILTYGLNARTNNYDLSIAPEGDNRDEYGAFVQDEILLGEKVRWVIGARWDDIDPVGSVVSPRTTLMFSPTPNNTFRASYNQAYRAPSVIENHIETAIVNQVLLPPIPPFLPGPTPFIFPSFVRGNPELDEEQLEAFEVGYVGTYGRTTFTVSVYRTETTDSTDFFTAAYYDSFNPPPGWPLPPLIPLPNGMVIQTVPTETFPSLFSYRNVGEQIDKGVEVSLQTRPSNNWMVSLNYSYQDRPEVTGIPEDEFNVPPEHRANFGLSYDTDRFYVNGNVNYTDEAFWTDVLDARFHGPTDSFTQVNLGFGLRFNEGRTTVAVIGNNVTDEDVQQHVFGDILGRKVTGEVRFRF